MFSIYQVFVQMHKTESILLIIYDVCTLSFEKNEKSNRKFQFVVKRKITKNKKKKKKKEKKKQNGKI